MEVGTVEAVIGALLSGGLITQLANSWSVKAKRKSRDRQEEAIADAKVRELSDRAVAELIKEGVLIGSRDAERLARQIEDMRAEIRTLVADKGALEERVRQLEDHVARLELERDRAVSRIRELERAS